MSEDRHDAVHHSREHRAAPPAGVSVVELVPTAPAPTPHLLGDPRLQQRGNGPLRQALLQQMQRTAGNRATRRLLQRLAAPPLRRPVVPIQTTRAGVLPIQRHDPLLDEDVPLPPAPAVQRVVVIQRETAAQKQTRYEGWAAATQARFTDVFIKMILHENPIVRELGYLYSAEGPGGIPVAPLTRRSDSTALLHERPQPGADYFFTGTTQSNQQALPRKVGGLTTSAGVFLRGYTPDKKVQSDANLIDMAVHEGLHWKTLVYGDQAEAVMAGTRMKFGTETLEDLKADYKDEFRAYWHQPNRSWKWFAWQAQATGAEKVAAVRRQLVGTAWGDLGAYKQFRTVYHGAATPQQEGESDARFQHRRDLAPAFKTFVDTYNAPEAAPSGEGTHAFGLATLAMRLSSGNKFAEFEQYIAAHAAQLAPVIADNASYRDALAAHIERVRERGPQGWANRVRAALGLG